jgi:hypothetical protein
MDSVTLALDFNFTGDQRPGAMKIKMGDAQTGAMKTIVDTAVLPSFTIRDNEFFCNRADRAFCVPVSDRGTADIACDPNGAERRIPFQIIWDGEDDDSVQVSQATPSYCPRLP